MRASTAAITGCTTATTLALATATAATTTTTLAATTTTTALAAATLATASATPSATTSLATGTSVLTTSGSSFAIGAATATATATATTTASTALATGSTARLLCASVHGLLVGLGLSCCGDSSSSSGSSSGSGSRGSAVVSVANTSVCVVVMRVSVRVFADLGLAGQHSGNLIDALAEHAKVDAFERALALKVRRKAVSGLLNVILVHVKELGNEADSDVEISLRVDVATLLSEHGLLSISRVRLTSEVVVHEQSVREATGDELGVRAATLLLLFLLLGLLHLQEVLLKLFKILQLSEHGAFRVQ